jgi:ATP-binding cassette subfamily F protein uup
VARKLLEYAEYNITSCDARSVFSDTVCNTIVELDNGSLYTYKGNYAYFLEKKAEREANEASEIDKARNLYRKELDWIRRQPKARGTKAKYR